MKFRTDFVTNSSDSSFLTFHIQNKALFDSLTKLGIKFKKVPKGEFSDKMKVVLPSGKSATIDGTDNWNLPYPTYCRSLSAWLVSLLLYEVEDEVDPPKELEDYSDFTKDLIQILNNAEIINLDWDAVEAWSRAEMLENLDAAFEKMDGQITDAVIEHNYGFEGEIGPCIYTEVHNGERMSVYYGSDTCMERESCSGLKLAVTGKLKYFHNRDELVEKIQELGGTVVGSVSKNTSYLVCDDVHSDTSNMKKTKALGIPVLSEMGFIQKFCPDYEYSASDGDDEECGEAEWEMTYSGGVLDFVMEHGKCPVEMQIWKDGRWV